MTMTFVKFQEDISLTGELFLHYNYPGNWWAHLKTSGALIMISNDTNLFRRREQKHILRKSKCSWLFCFVCVEASNFLRTFNAHDQRCKCKNQCVICKQQWRWFVWAIVTRHRCLNTNYNFDVERHICPYTLLIAGRLSHPQEGADLGFHTFGK